MPYEEDKFGLPVDPILRNLQLSLADFVGLWIQAYGNAANQSQIVLDYHATVARLYRLGWDGVLDADSVLPEKLMPTEYTMKHPNSFKGLFENRNSDY